MPLALRALEDPSSASRHRDSARSHSRPRRSVESRLSPRRWRASRRSSTTSLTLRPGSASARPPLSRTSRSSPARSRRSVRAACRTAAVKAIQPTGRRGPTLSKGKALIDSDDLLNNFGGDGNGITVVVLDSGINAGHPDLAGKVDEVRSYAGPEGQDGFNHGTKVAGIIAGDNGLAPQARLWDVRVIDSAGVATIEDPARSPRRPDAGCRQHRHHGRRALESTSRRFELVRQPPVSGSVDVVNFFRDAGKLLIGSAGSNADPAGIGTGRASRRSSPPAPSTTPTSAHKAPSAAPTAPPRRIKSPATATAVRWWTSMGPADCARAPQAAGGFDECFGGTSASAAYVAGAAAQIWSRRQQASAA